MRAHPFTTLLLSIRNERAKVRHATPDAPSGTPVAMETGVIRTITDELEDNMSERPETDDSRTFAPRDTGTRPAHDGAPDHLTPSGTSGQSVGGPRVGGEPAMPGTSEYEREVDHTQGKSPMGISTGLLWTVGILLIVAVALILFFAL